MEDQKRGPGRPKSVTTEDTAGFEPIRFGKLASFVTHTFKLTLSHFKRHFLNDNEQPTPQDWHNTEHVHWFHTVTSDGKEQLYSNSIGGHFHKMEVVQGPKGTVPKVKCISGPLKYVKVKNQYGKFVKSVAPFNPGIDEHTHETQYLKSDEIKPKTVNTETAKVISMDALKTAPIPGVEA